ncbi:uncharacterized protein EMH_0073090 [Eimeria mitis]|uniref:Uncharacterized protein n=1 Tax=Eimeria mitis TaxID=44415 RepID=U6KE10_9EIME|nr:uncharacterized protein EMH_0073090 [Eimeria mitis]CDJ36265.1 hypothetical protein, conserved [Eimeria mitis]
MLKKRSSLLRSLHEVSAKQRLLYSRDQQLALQVSPSSLEDRRRVQGRLSKLEAEARLLESKLCRVRHELKYLIPRKQHLALSLRLVAGRRASGAFIAPSAAAALSAAIIIVEGNESKHFVATSAEEAEILKMSAELLTRMQKSTESLVKKLEASKSGSGGGLAVLRDFWALERQYKKCISLQKGASTFIRQLRFVLMSVSPRRIIEELEEADRELRKSMERCTYFLQNRRHSNDSGILRSLFKRLRVKSGRAGGTKALTNEAVDNTSLG